MISLPRTRFPLWTDLHTPTQQGRGEHLDAFATLAVGGLLSALLALGAPSHAQTPRNDETFDDNVMVLEVEVPVRVLRAGVPVPGLSAEDFVLLDRGQQQTITGFEVQDIREERLAMVETGRPTSDVAPQIAPGATNVSRASRRNQLVIFDLNQLGSRAFLRARPRLDAWLSRPFAPVDRVAFALFGSADGRTPRDKSVRLLTPFTADRAQLRHALDVVASVYQLKPQKTEQALAALRTYASRTESKAEMRATIRELGLPVALSLLGTPHGESSSLGRLGDQRFTKGLAERESFRAVQDGRGIFGDADFVISSGSPESRLRWLALAMAEVVTLLADLEGQNHIVLMSEPGYPTVEDSNTTERLEPMHNAFRRSGWTFHAIDASGVGFRGDTLFYMANETGGELLENQLEIDGALDRLSARTDVTYRLTFQPTDLGDPGSYHRLKVRLAQGDGPRVTVQHRQGYYAPRPDGEIVREEDWFSLEALLLEGRLLNEDVIRIDAEATPQDGKTALTIEVDTARLLAGHRDRATLELTVLAVNRSGEIAARHERTIVDAEAGEPIRETVRLALGAERYRVRILVRGDATGALALASKDLDLSSKGGKRRRGT